MNLTFNLQKISASYEQTVIFGHLKKKKQPLLNKDQQNHEFYYHGHNIQFEKKESKQFCCC